MSFLAFMFGGVSIGTLVGFLVGPFWGVSVFLISFVSWLSYRNSDQSNPDQFKDHIPERSSQRPVSRRKKVIDEIQFDYIPAHGTKGTYTVKVVKGLRGNIEGYCHERVDIRTFRIDRIVDDTVIRTETGEVMSLKQWRSIFRKSKS